MFKKEFFSSLPSDYDQYFSQNLISCKRFSAINGNGFGYGFVAEKSAGIFPMNNEYTKKRWIPNTEFSRNEL